VLANIFADMMAATRDLSPLSSHSSANLSFLERAISKPPEIITSAGKSVQCIQNDCHRLPFCGLCVPIGAGVGEVSAF